MLVPYKSCRVVSLTFILLSFLNHAINLFLGQMALVVNDSDAVRLSGRLVQCRDLQNTVSIHIKHDFDLRDTTRSRRDTRELKLSEQVVVLGASALSYTWISTPDWLSEYVEKISVFLWELWWYALWKQSWHRQQSQYQGKKGQRQEEDLESSQRCCCRREWRLGVRHHGWQPHQGWCSCWAPCRRRSRKLVWRYEGYKWNRRPRQFHERLTCRSWSPGGPSRQGLECYRTDPGIALRNGHELGKCRNRRPQIENWFWWKFV